AGTDYELTFGSAGEVIINAVEGGGIADNDTLTITYSKLDPTAVASADVIGGIDPVSGQAAGLELLNEVFPRFRIVPGQVLAPGFSTDPAVAAVMRAKASNINSHFKAMALCDIPTDTVDKYADAPAWKNSNNLVD